MSNTAEQEWAAVTIPYVIREDASDHDPDQFDKYLEEPLKTSYPCHQQAVERAVALMTAVKLKCATDEGKSGHQGIIAEERQKNPGGKKKRKLNHND